MGNWKIENINFLLLKGYCDTRLSGKASDKQSCSDDVEQEGRASSDFITAKQKYVSSIVLLRLIFVM